MLADSKRSRRRIAPINPRSRVIQIRLLILVAITLGILTIGEGLVTGRFNFDSVNPLGPASSRPVETRLAAETPVSVESLSVISLPVTPKPWQKSTANEDVSTASTGFKETEADFWKHLYQAIRVKQRDYFQASLRFALRDQALPLGTSDRAELLRNLKSFAQAYFAKSLKELSASTVLASDRKAEFQAALESLQREWSESLEPALGRVLEGEALSAEDKEACKKVEATWRALSLKEVQDDEPSPSKDFVAWFGFVDSLQHDAAALDGAREVSYANLFDQSADFRGKPILVKGIIRAAEYVKTGPNLYGVEGYYVCWIRPDNYQDAPIKVFSLTAFEGVGADSKAEDLASLIDKPCELRGIFFKRMVYRAQDDLRTVPTVIAAKVAILKPDTSVKDANDSVSFTMLVLLAAVVSAVLLVIYLFTDRTRIKSLPEKLELPTKPANES